MNLDVQHVLVSKARQKAMKNIWFYLIWLIVVVFEEHLYSIFTFFMKGPQCEPLHVSNQADAFIDYIDRMTGY